MKTILPRGIVFSEVVRRKVVSYFGPNSAYRYARATFHALVDAMIPEEWRLEARGLAPVAGAAQLGVDRFVMQELDQSQFIPMDAEPASVPALSWSSAVMLNVGADTLVRRGAARPIWAYPAFPGGSLFAALAPDDRLEVMGLLDHLEVPMELLPPPFRNNPGLIRTMVNSFYQLTMFGYYSEWYGYGSSRFYPPGYRSIEFCPPVWRRIGYPGPAFGYRDYRGLLLKYPHDKGGYHHE